MAGLLIQVVVLLVAITARQTASQTASQPATTCGDVQTFAEGAFICSFPPNCCTRLLCSISFLMVEAARMDIRINPCTDPATLSIVADAGGTTIFNMSGISTSQSIPINYGDVLDTSVDIFFNSTRNSATIGMSAFGTVIIPPTTIDISDPGCQAGSMSLPPTCFTTEAPPATSSPSLQPPASGPTCQALQQLAGGGNIGAPNSCFVTDGCTTVSCTYLGMYPISLTLLPCNDPPGMKFVAYDAPNGNVVFNETITDSRRIALDELGTGFAIIVSIDHPCGQDAIIAEAVFSTVFNSTILPPTMIPVDQSNCSRIATPMPCDEPVTSFDDVCDAVQSALQSSASTCTTNYPDCTTTMCNLGQFNVPVTYGYTIMPCTEIPSVMVRAVDNGTVILDETLSNSRVETINIGPTNVSVRFTVNQSPPDFQTIGVGVNLVSTDPPIDVPLFPLTEIPLDRCSCATVNCDSMPSPRTTGSSATTQQPSAGNPDSSSSNDGRVIAPAVIAAVLFVALVVVIVVAIVLLIYINRRHTIELKSTMDVSYKNLATKEKEEQP